MKTVELLEKYEKEIRQEKWEKFSIFRELLLEYNEKYNLTTILEEKDMFYKHFLDSVAGERFFKRDARVAEIGSGAGFPSIPLKIFRPDLSFDLFESVGKKCDFLQAVVDKLGLDKMNIYNLRAETAGKDVHFREKYDHVTARAVARMNTLSEYCLPFVKKGGYFCALKGYDVEEELKGASKAIALLGGKVEKVNKYTLPDGSKRSIVCIKKISQTNPKYPRPSAKIAKNPLM